MMELSFLCKKKILARLKQKTIYALTCLVMKIDWFFQSMFQIKNLKDSMDLFLLIYNDKSHHVYIKDFDRFMFHKTKHKNKKMVL